MTPRKPRRTLAAIEENLPPVGRFVRYRRKLLGLTQEQLAMRSGTSLNFIKQLEMGKPTLRMDKVNQVLFLFGAQLYPWDPRKVDPTWPA